MRALLVAGLVCALGAEARAYPQYQLTTGAVRCNQCHYAPAGGGLISGWGREEAGATISMGGDGAFLHGLWTPPSWAALGADVRVAAIASNAGDPAVFPMQADAYARLARGAWSIYGVAGLRGAARVEDRAASAWFVSREHYVMWRPKTVGWYARAGKYFAPYGLRFAEHLYFARRALGWNLFEETYGLSLGRVTDGWEAHATAFVPDFDRPTGDRGSGGALLFEKRFGDRAVAGAQARLAIADEGTRLQGGVLAKWRPGPAGLLLYAEADLVRETFAMVDAPRAQLVAMVGASATPLRGLLVDLVGERFDEDLSVAAVERDALSLQVHWFPRAHVEVTALGRAQWIGLGDGGPTTTLAMLQLHYYL
jgi:hypothetical protein